VVVKPTGDGLIQQVARILDSPVLSGPATLSALLGSLDAKLLFSESQVPDPKPLEVHQMWITPAPAATYATKSLFLAPAPERFAANTELIPASPQNLEHIRIIPPTGEQVAEWLDTYPTLRGLGVPTEVIGPEEAGGRFGRDDWIIKLIWDGGAQIAGVKQSDWTVEHLDELYSYAWNGTYGVVLPSVAGNTEPYDLVVAWWLVLYCLSMLARYYPKEWTEILDVDRSPLAVPIEHVLSVAYAAVPALIAFRLRLLRGMQDRT
jgi:hypothetical protein